MYSYLFQRYLFKIVRKELDQNMNSGSEFKLSFFLDWLTYKARDQSLSCYLTYRWVRRDVFISSPRIFVQNWTQGTRPEYELIMRLDGCVMLSRSKKFPGLVNTVFEIVPSKRYPLDRNQTKEYIVFSMIWQSTVRHYIMAKLSSITLRNAHVLLSYCSPLPLFSLWNH